MFNETTDIFAKSMLSGALGGALITLFIASILAIILVIIVMYIYMSLAYMRVAQHVRYKTPAIAWIPVVGPALIVSHGAKMPSWPIFLLLGALFPWIGWMFLIAFTVFSLFWHYKTYESLSRPGWWSLFNLIQPVGLIFLGIVAWGKNTRPRSTPQPAMQKSARKKRK